MEKSFRFQESLSPEKSAAEGISKESREKMRDQTLARLIIVRHFPALYGEEEGTAAKNYDLISTPEQMYKNKGRAKQISRIFGDNEVVAFWTSPRKRAEGTKEILKRQIQNQKYPDPVVKDKIISSLQSAKVPSDYYEKFLQENISSGWFVHHQKTPEEGKAGLDRVESVEEVARRFKRVFNAFNRFTRKSYGNADATDKKEIINVIAVTHGEVPNDFVETVFGFGFSHHGDFEKQELGRGENLLIEARRASDGMLHYFATMRKKTVEFQFDSKTRTFSSQSAIEVKSL